MRLTAAWVLVLVLTFPVVGEEQPKAQPAGEVKIQPEAAVALAKKAVSELRGKLMSRVKRAMKAGGAPAAVQACSQQAAKLASGVAKRHSLLIGRTSNRLRNPRNKAPDWMVPILAQEAVLKGPQVAKRPEGYGVAFPIQTGKACLRCHGPKANLDPELKERLRALYPADAAVGFNKGDLRGWFWVEVPNRKWPLAP